jgi:hypothetical protein
MDFYKRVNVDTAFYWFTLNAAPADSMHFMTNNEINSYFKAKLKQPH